MAKPNPLWRHRDPLTLVEAAALLADLDPAEVSARPGRPPSHPDGAFQAAYRLLTDAILALDLPAEIAFTPLYRRIRQDGGSQTVYADGLGAETRIKRADLIRWAQDRGLPLGFLAENPPDAAPQPPSLEPDPPPKPLSSRERDTLLIILAAVMQAAGLDPKDRGAATRIARMTEAIGCGISDDTIRRWLAQIDEALERRRRE